MKVIVGCQAAIQFRGLLSAWVIGRISLTNQFVAIICPLYPEAGDQQAEDKKND